MKTLRRHQLAPVLCIAGAGLLASGQTHADPTVKVSGFGTLAADQNHTRCLRVSNLDEPGARDRHRLGFGS